MHSYLVFDLLFDFKYTEGRTMALEHGFIDSSIQDEFVGGLVDGFKDDLGGGFEGGLGGRFGVR